MEREEEKEGRRGHGDDKGDWYLGTLAVLQDGFVCLLGGEVAGASSVQVLKHARAHTYTQNHDMLSHLLLWRT